MSDGVYGLIRIYVSLRRTKLPRNKSSRRTRCDSIAIDSIAIVSIIGKTRGAFPSFPSRPFVSVPVPSFPSFAAGVLEAYGGLVYTPVNSTQQHHIYIYAVYFSFC